MIDARVLYDACFHAAVAVSQTFIAVVAGLGFRAVVLSEAAPGAKSLLKGWRSWETPGSSVDANFSSRRSSQF